ncbi:hypothetical protein C7N43_29925 [Sphingobacteriales bacterium UPWRP_1]|nr:hypothetical protein B6N25_13115 [Sphingobacteriales bacterium TSM_CSS]PSJ73291.1 hypothetical protein C7N43_29925 [Sphingobacteriales bacterium UPWRP_1]
MKAKMQHIAAILMAMLILVSSAGIAVNEHFCQRSNLYEVSMLPIAKCETKLTGKHACCKAMIKNCCTTQNGTANAGQQTTEQSCCSHTTDYLALETDMVVSGISKQEQQLPVFSTIFLLTCLQISNPAVANTTATTRALLYKNSYPPTIRQSCSVLQVFIC